MKCVVIQDFYDATDNNKLVKKGSVYECSEERANVLAVAGFVDILNSATEEEITTEEETGTEEEITTEENSATEEETIAEEIVENADIKHKPKKK